MLDEQLDDARVALARGARERALTVGAADAGVGAGLEQHPGDRLEAVRRGDLQRRRAGGVRGVDVGARADQRAHHVGAALGAGAVERRLPGVGGVVHRRARREQHLHDLELPGLRRLAERRLAAAALRVDVGALGDHDRDHPHVALPRRLDEEVVGDAQLGQEQRRVGLRHVGARAAQLVDHVAVAFLGGGLERGLAGRSRASRPTRRRRAACGRRRRGPCRRRRSARSCRRRTSR